MSRIYKIILATTITLLTAVLYMVFVQQTKSNDQNEQDVEAVDLTNSKARETKITTKPTRNRGKIDDKQLTPLLSNDAEKIRTWLEGVSPDERGLRLNAGSRELQRHIRNSGDYKPLIQLMGLVTVQEARNLIFWGIGVKSTLGVDHDVAEQTKLANYFGDNKSIIYERKVYHAVGAKQLKELADSKLLSELNQEQFLSICYGATREGIGQGFQAVNLATGEERKRAAASAVMRQAMMQNSLRASDEVIKLPEGIIRDEAVASMIEYLVEKGSIEEAKPWYSYINDEAARKRASAVITKQK